MNTTSTGDRHTRQGASGATTAPSAPPTSPGARPTADDVAVTATGLRCAYGDYEAVRGIDLTAYRGELLAVLGTNGAGKTTTLEALEGRRAPDGGGVRVLGMDPRRQRRRLAARIGVVLQESALPDELTPAEFLALWHKMTGAGKLAHRPVDEQLARVDLMHRRDVRIGRLSGGERRRLDLATALSADPELLFLDEPTAGLDPESRAGTWELLRDLLRTGTTAVLTTHYLEEAEALADRLAILHDGRIAVAGALDEVLAARDARIRCDLDPGAPSLPQPLTGHATVTPQRDGHHIEIRTRDLADDLATLLGWSQTHAVALRHLHASEPTLAEVFHDVAGTTREEATI
ncbi:ABC transporter ATP-binding protein [Egibacter rhizosphaerae]|uniref:ABC transporter ATP-binding protein n=1 Tax=Egibacter rhizosphaerae TaxID=1670831 RepID=A0A411YBD6_9ACTN|nr:ABC transporter ATP-binding protein [Egibacter rhizosphaerae]QBI18495.1 ABC transporter ATP-binding protein [Egibacter rhizosphaerae]